MNMAWLMNCMHCNHAQRIEQPYEGVASKTNHALKMIIVEN